MDLDSSVVVGLNHWFAQSPGLYVIEQSVADLPELILPAILVFWWFSDPGSRSKTYELRRRAILALGALPVTYVVAHLIQLFVRHPRPLIALKLQTSDPAGFARSQSDLTKLGSFPSDHEALLFVLVVFAFSVNRKLGATVLAFAIIYGLLRVAIGLHYPSDILGGAVLGSTIAFALLGIEWRMAPALDRVLSYIQRHRALSYAIGFVVFAEFAGGLNRIRAAAKALSLTLFH